MTTRVMNLWDKFHNASPFTGRVLLTSSTNVVLALLGLVTGVLVARLLGPQGRGELAAIQTWPSFFATIAMLGLPQALVYFCSRESTRSGSLLTTAMLLALFSSVPFMIAGYVAMPTFLASQSPEIIEAARWYLYLVPVFALVGLPFHPLQGRGDFTYWNGLRLTPSLGWLMVLIAAWISGEVTPANLAAEYLLVLALLFFPIIYIVSIRIPGSYRPNGKDVRPMLRYGLPSMASNIPQALNVRLDQMLIAGILSPQLLGLYVVAVAWGNVVMPILGALGSVIFPQVASQETAAQQSNVFVQGVRLGTLASFLITAVLLVITPWAIPIIFGDDFSGAIKIAYILVLAGGVAGLNTVMEKGLQGLGFPAAVMKAEFVGLFVTALSLLVLLKPLGIIGAAVSSFFGQLSITLFLAIKASSHCGISIPTLLRPNFSEFYGHAIRILKRMA